MRKLITAILFIGSLALAWWLIKPVIQRSVVQHQALGAVAGQQTAPPETSSSEQTIDIPKKLYIPKLGVEANVESVGLDDQNKMDNPKKNEDVAWYNLGFKPGEGGSAVMAGHLDTKSGAPAVFYDLNKLTPGDQLSVTDWGDRTYQFKVTQVRKYPDAQFPLKEVFGSSGKSTLNLITCGGTWDSIAKNYSDRWVVYSEITQ